MCTRATLPFEITLRHSSHSHLRVSTNSRTTVWDPLSIRWRMREFCASRRTQIDRALRPAAPTGMHRTDRSHPRDTLREIAVLGKIARREGTMVFHAVASWASHHALL